MALMDLTDYSGLSSYFRSLRAAFVDRSIRRGIIIVEGEYIACQTWIEGRFVHGFSQLPVGLPPPNGATVTWDLSNIFRVDERGRPHRRVGAHRQQERSAATRSLDSGHVTTRKKARRGKQFFFEKKNQKTFDSAVARPLKGPRQPDKSFLLLFLQKSRPCLPTSDPHGPSPFLPTPDRSSCHDRRRGREAHQACSCAPTRA